KKAVSLYKEIGDLSGQIDRLEAIEIIDLSPQAVSLDEAAKMAKETKEKELKKFKEELDPAYKKAVAAGQQTAKKVEDLDKNNPDNARLKEGQKELEAMLKEMESKYESLRKELEYKEKIILELKKWLGVEYSEDVNNQKDWDEKVTLLSLAAKGKLSPHDKDVITQLNKELLIDGIENRFNEIEKIYYYIRGLIKTGEQANLEIEKKELEAELARLKQGDTRKKDSRGFRTSVDVSLEIEEADSKIKLMAKEVELAKLRTANSKPALEQVSNAGLEQLLEKEIAGIKRQLEAIGEEKRLRKDAPGILEAVIKGDFEKAERKTLDMLVKKYQAEAKVNKDKAEVEVKVKDNNEDRI
ncbi:MAG TPA: hypothetical protein DCL49_03785, partial [Candidatus Omnitrophica bacterium]|nr:hypothetical protein [Candidatus Omnitrophota bacterium]